MSGGGIFHIMNMGNEALMNSRVGVDVTGHNIASAHIPGYSRQRVNMVNRDPLTAGNLVMGNGATVENISRVHDRYLENQIRKETQTQSEKSSMQVGLERLEGLFNPELTSTIRDRFNGFFNSMRELCNYPEEPSVRTNVLESAKNLTASINTTYNQVTQIQRDINDEITSEVSTLNQKLDEVANLNQRILELKVGNSNANDLMDRRDVVVKEIAGLIDVTSYESGPGNLALRGPHQELLLDGVHPGKFQLGKFAQGENPRIEFRALDNEGTVDITDHITTGKLGGLVKVRDGYGDSLKRELNAMAQTFGDSFNAVHRQGFGAKNYSEIKGRDFFEGLNVPNGSPAALISVSADIQADPFAIAAAMMPNSPGDNVIANDMLKLQYAHIADEGRSTIADAYDRFVGKLGVDALRTKEDLNASNIVQSQLQSQKESVSGVSLDEEASNLLKYQQLFQASSRVITTADELMKTVLELKR